MNTFEHLHLAVLSFAAAVSEGLPGNSPLLGPIKSRAATWATSGKETRALAKSKQIGGTNLPITAYLLFNPKGLRRADL